MALFERDFQKGPLEVTYLLSFLQRSMQAVVGTEFFFSSSLQEWGSKSKSGFAFTETHKKKKLQMSYHRPEIPCQVERIFVKGERK